MDTCKNCGKQIIWGLRGNGLGFAYFHVETEIMQCYPNNPVAEPIKEDNNDN